MDGRPYLIDCGYGTVRSLVASGLGYQQIGTVFLTHLHDDHTTDIPALLTQQWTGSKATPTAVYGPFGTVALVDAALAFLKANADIRIVDEGRTTRPETLYQGARHHRDRHAGAGVRRRSNQGHAPSRTPTSPIAPRRT